MMEIRGERKRELKYKQNGRWKEIKGRIKTGIGHIVPRQREKRSSWKLERPAITGQKAVYPSLTIF